MLPEQTLIGGEWANSCLRYTEGFTTSKGYRMPLSPGKIKHMNALSNDKGVIAAAAMDQRGSLRKSIAGAKGVPQEQVTDDMMSEFKVVISKILTQHAS